MEEEKNKDREKQEAGLRKQNRESKEAKNQVMI